MDTDKKGYVYAITAVLFLIVWPIFSKLGFGFFNVETTAVLWFSTAALFSFVLLLWRSNLHEFVTVKTHWRWIFLSGGINTIGVIASWKALDILMPSMHNFLMKINILMMMLFGILFLKERYNRYEFLSAGIIIIGVYMMTRTNGTYVFQGVLYMLIFAACYTLSRAIYKDKMKEISPLMMVLYRTSSIALFSLLYAVMTASITLYWSVGLLYATVPSIFSAVIAHILIFRAYKLIDYSKVELVLTAAPFLVLIISFFVFGETFMIIQFLGGILIVVGIISLIRFRPQTKNI